MYQDVHRAANEHPCTSPHAGYKSTRQRTYTYMQYYPVLRSISDNHQSDSCTRIYPVGTHHNHHHLERSWRENCRVLCIWRRLYPSIWCYFHHMSMLLCMCTCKQYVVVRLCWWYTHLSGNYSHICCLIRRNHHLLLRNSVPRCHLSWKCCILSLLLTHFLRVYEKFLYY